MKLTHLRIEAFGHFNNQDFPPLHPRATVFYGPNEAGKTTLLEFIRAILFGFLDGRSSRNLYQLSDARHGGAISIETDDGDAATIRRTRGRGRGTVTLSASDGSPIPETELSRLLGGNSRGTFESIFAFTLDELHDAALLNDSTVNAQIYAATTGASNLPDALSRLDARKRSLFLPGGSTQEIYHIANDLDPIETQLRQAADNAQTYRAESERLANVNRRIAELDILRKRWNDDLQRQRSLSQAWDPWNAMTAASARLSELPVAPDFPEDGVARLDGLNERAQTAREDIETADAEIRAHQEQADAPIPHQSLLEHSRAIRYLERRRTAFDQSAQAIPTLTRKLEETNDALNKSLSDLGSDWDADRLEAFDLSLLVRQEISDHADTQRARRTAVQTAESALAASETALADAAADADRIRSDLDAAPVPTLDENGVRDRAAKLRDARERAGEYARSQTRIDDLNDQIAAASESDSESDNPPTFYTYAGPAIAVFGVGGILYGVLEGPWTIALLGVVILVCAAIVLYSGSRPQKTPESPVAQLARRQLETETRRLDDLRSQLEQDAADLGFDPLDPNALSAAESSLEDKRSRLDQYARLSADLRTADDNVRRLSVRRDEADAARQCARADLDAAQADWRQWLSARALRDDFSPESVDVLIGAVNLARAHQSDCRAAERSLASNRAAIAEFMNLLAPLAAECGLDLPPDDRARAAAIADEVIDLHSAASDQSRNRADAEKNLQSARADLARRQRRLKDIERQTADLLQAAGAQDDEDFRRLARLRAERQNLATQRDNARDQLQLISGPCDALSNLLDELSRTNQQTIQENLANAERELSQIDSDIQDQATQRGAIQTTLSALLGEEESTALRAERQRLLESVRYRARQWATLAIAENLLREAQSKFERERQPAVINHSTDLFRRITDGRYQTVYAPLGTSEIRVTDAAGASKQPSELSRGTREQLFLALRFGLIREMGQRSERLPIIIDEALINFDPTRAQNAARAFLELSQTNQLLTFTCHPWIVETFQKAAAQTNAPEPTVIEIG